MKEGDRIQTKFCFTMKAFNCGNGGIWRWNWEKRRGRQNEARSKGPNSSDSVGNSFPFKQALTAASLTLTGDTIAQLSQRWTHLSSNHRAKDRDIITEILSDHDWIRALRMVSYGFLLYGPGSYAWYQYLDYCLPKPTVQNLMLKVLLNQVVLGPCVIAVVFAWNNLWLGKLPQLPEKYRKDALPTLLYGFRFWIPVSVLNFWVVPLQARVAFMSVGSIFWNFYLSSTMSR